MMLYVGATYSAVDNWMEILPEITAPSNYKDPAKIEAYMRDKLQELQEGGAAHDSLTGSVGRIIVLARGKEGDLYKAGHDTKLEADSDPKVVLDSFNGAPFIQLLVAQLEESKNLGVIGCGIQRLVRIAALDYIAHEGNLPMAVHELIGLGEVAYNRLPGLIDPLSVLFGSSRTDVRGAATRLTGQSPVAIEENAEEAALFAFTAAQKLGY